MHTALIGLAVLALIVLLLGLLAGALIAQQISQPIRRLAGAARSVAAGDLDARATVEGSTEQRSLARAFNEMTGRLAPSSRPAGLCRRCVASAAYAPYGLAAADRGGAGIDPRTAILRAPSSMPMREIDRLSLIVDELLVLSRAGEHELPARSSTWPGERASAERWRRTAAERRIRVVHDRAGSPGKTWFAPADLDRVLDALFENALRYGPAESTVTIRSGTDRIEILDGDQAWDPNEEELVFERFYRGRAGRVVAEGTGLGPRDRPGADARMGRPRVALQPARGRGASAVEAPPPSLRHAPIAPISLQSLYPPLAQPFRWRLYG